MLALLTGIVIASSQGAPISLGPGSFSYPDLAKALTKAGMTTDVSASLRDRAAFVHLKARTPQTVREVLTETLGVSFSPQADGSWRIVPDPEVQKQERRFNAEYRRVLAKRFDQLIAPRRQFLHQRSYQTVVQDLRRELLDLDNRKEDPKRQSLLVTQYVSFADITHWALNKTRGSELVANLRHIEIAYPFDLANVALRKQQPQRVSPHAQLVLRGNFKPVDGIAQCYTRLREGRTEEDIVLGNDLLLRPTVDSNGSPVSIPLDTVTPKETFVEMSPVAAAYEAGFLPLPDLGNRLVTPTQTGCLSVALESLQKDAPEAVFELSVLFDHLPSDGAGLYPPKPVTLRSLFSPVPLSSGRTFDNWPEHVQANTSATSQMMGERYFPWRYRQRDGILEAFNLYQFLDHTLGTSPVPYLQAQSYIKSTGDDLPAEGGSRIYTWHQRVRLSRIFRNTNATEIYRDIVPAEFKSGEEFIERIEALPGNVREAIWKNLALDGKASVQDFRGYLNLTADRVIYDEDIPAPFWTITIQEATGAQVRKITFMLIGRGTLDRYLPK